MALLLSGNFIQTPFLDVLTILRLQKATGTLTCIIKNCEKQVYVKNGQIIFATSQDERDRFGETLVNIGMITRSQLNIVLEHHRKSSGIKKIGAIFVEHGFLTPKELFFGLKAQVRGILHSLLLVAEGDYKFEETIPPDVIPLQINIDELMREVNK